MTPRQLRDSSFPARLDAEPEPKWWQQIGYVAAGAILMWAFLALVLGWPGNG